LTPSFLSCRALHYACHHGQEEAALLLLDHAAVCSSGMEGLAKLRDCWGCTALMVAAEEGQVNASP
jgi:ankyrin repeat protein